MNPNACQNPTPLAHHDRMVEHIRCCVLKINDKREEPDMNNDQTGQKHPRCSMLSGAKGARRFINN